MKRRIDGLRKSGALLGFTALVDYEARGWSVEAHVHLYLRAGQVKREQFVRSLEGHPEILEAWMISGESDAVAHVRTKDAETLEALILALKRDGLVERTRSEIVLSHLVARRTIPFDLDRV